MAIAEWGVVVLDCPDPRALATFYGAVLDWSVDERETDEDWVELAGPDGRRLAFQLAPGYQPPRWPSSDGDQQFHLDFRVPRERMDAAEREVLALGAKLLEGDHDGVRSWWVYADPVGHLFCFCAV